MPMTTGLIFLRHSLPLIDLTIPAREWHISEEGRQRCVQLAAQLANYNPQRIVSSREPKAMETAKIVAEALRMTYESAEGLHEHVRSRIEPTSQDVFEASVKAFFEKTDCLVYGDETADQARSRFTHAIEAIQERYHDQYPLVIVSHGTVISLYIANIYDLEPFEFWKSLKLPCLVVLSPGKPKIVSLESPASYSPIP
jgi:broad specificity phosphatase PhoE